MLSVERWGGPCCVWRGGGHVGIEVESHVKDEVMKTKLIVGGPHVECGDQISPPSCPGQYNYPITFGTWAPSACWGLQEPGSPAPRMHSLASLCSGEGRDSRPQRPSKGRRLETGTPVLRCGCCSRDWKNRNWSWGPSSRAPCPAG